MIPQVCPRVNLRNIRINLRFSLLSKLPKRVEVHQQKKRKKELQEEMMQLQHLKPLILLVCLLVNLRNISKRLRMPKLLPLVEEAAGGGRLPLFCMENHSAKSQVLHLESRRKYVGGRL